MKFVPSALLVCVLAAAGTPAWSAPDDQHDAHHPATAEATAAPAPTPDSMAEKSSPDLARIDTQMKAMREMHGRMMAARTTEERKALMAEHMKVMHDGMKMMGELSSGGMADMCMMSGRSPGAAGNKHHDMAKHHQMMGKHMEMMQAMMQMMMDHLSVPPTK